MVSPKLVVLLAAWLGSIALGMGVLADYTFGPGKSGNPPSLWPVASALAAEDEVPTLVMIAHPRCPCTRASIAELSRLMTVLGTRATAHVIVVEPEGAKSGFAESDIARAAADIGGVSLLVDEGGREARRFGALTSGQVVLYSAEGELLFAGGITAGRGHEGESSGSVRIRRLIDDRDIDSTRSPVFGCALDSEGRT